MPAISNTPRPGYAYDSTDDVWYPIGTGPHTHADYITSGSAINPNIVDAKGDIIAASAADTPARLAVGNNGETLVADSSTSTGLRWQGDYAAGKNKIINGDFRINQRNFSTITTGQGYGFDRWNHVTNGGTITYSTQNFTPGTAPVAGYEGTTFARMDVAGGASAGDFCILQQKIEDVRTFAGQTVTVSLWAKSDTAGDKLGIELFQDFGSGGSSDTGAAGQSVTLTTSWARYSVTIANPSISGKTIGTSSLLEMNLWVTAGTTFNTRSGTVGVQTAVIDIWGVQVEAGSTATAFQTATGTLQGELAACQRYLPCFTPENTASSEYYIGYAALTNTSIYTIPFHVQARVAPTGITVSGTFGAFAGNTSTTVTPTFDAGGVNSGGIVASHTITQGQGSRLALNPGARILFTGCEL